MKKNNVVFIVCLCLLIGLLAGSVVLFVVQTAQNGWEIDKNNASKFGVVIIGLIISLVKLINRTGSSPSLRTYEISYSKEIGAAFSTPDKKKQKRTLLTAIARYSENKMNGAVYRLQALRNECKTKDDYSAVLLFLALCYSDMGADTDAIAVYEELLRIAPEHSTAWSNLGHLYRRSGNFDRAVSCLENAIKCDDQNAYAWNNLAQVYLRASQWEKVIEPAKRSVQRKSDMHQAESALCIAYFALGDREKSKEHFDKAVMNGADSNALTSLLSGIAQGETAFGSEDHIRDEIVRANGHLQRDTALPMVEIRLPAPDDGNRSRLGGAPVDSTVPLDGAGNPMHILAAIWCSEVHGVPDFPSKGVLRFYIADNDLYGADFDNPTKQIDFRVLYDESEESFAAEQRDDVNISEAFPIPHVLPIRLTPAMGSVRTSDYRFEESVNSALRKANVTSGFAELSMDEQDFLCEANHYAGHRIGGYPIFEQTDPRDGNPELQKYDTLLLQIVSHMEPAENGANRDLIMFGDLGGCQFFIPQDKLRARDFSDILYTWDCG